MKFDLRGHPSDGAQEAGNLSARAGSRKPFRRWMFTMVAVVVAALVAGIVARHTVVGFFVSRGLSIATGVRVTFGDQRIGGAAAQFDDVDVTTAGGEPLFAARSVTLRYSLSALAGGRGPRFGLEAISLAHPIFSIVRFANGAYSIGGRSGGSGATAGGGGGLPWRLNVRVRDGEVRLIDRAPVAPDLAQQRFLGLTLDARIASDGRSGLRGSMRYAGRQTASDRLADWPIGISGFADVPRGLAIARISASRIPLRGPIGFLQHSSAVRVDDGVVHDFGLRVFALDLGADRAPDIHLAAGGDVAGGRLAIGALREPVRHVGGRIVLLDDGVWSRRLTGDLAGIPIRARGGAYDRQAPVIRLGVRADGDLGDLRSAFNFSAHAPIRGPARVETLLEAPVSHILIRTAVAVPRGSYAGVPFSEVSGRVDYHRSTVVLDGIAGRYGPAALAVGGTFTLGGPAVVSNIAAAAIAPGRAIPYAENLAPASPIDLVALISGSGARFRTRGAIGAAGGGTAGRGLFAVDELGVGEFGPIVLDRADGSSLIGALRLERPLSESAAWISARGYRVAVPPAPAHFPGLTVAAFPPVAGVFDGDIAGAGAPHAFALTGSLRGDDVRVAGAALGRGGAELAGTLDDVRLARLTLAGPTGSFAGSAAAAGGTFALHGRYRGSLEQLVPFTGPQDASGAVDGQVLVQIGGSSVVVQSPQARLRDGFVRGVAVDTAAGTIAVRDRRFALVAATGSIGGARAVAADAAGQIALSAPRLPVRALARTGVPLAAGWVSAYGLADLRGPAPRFDGEVVVADGRSAGYGLAGNGHVALAGDRVELHAASVALASTFGSLDGVVSGIGKGGLGYALRAYVPLGDIATLGRGLHLRLPHVDGSFSARLRLDGSRSRPELTGDVTIPEGVFHGLAFASAGAAVDAGPGHMSATHGHIVVGSTAATFAAAASRGGFAVSAAAPAADLADFDDYFDTSGTIGGRGSLAVDLSAGRAGLRSHGVVVLRGAHFQTFALPSADLTWGMRGRSIAGHAAGSGPAGSVRVRATIEPANGDLHRAFSAARYDGEATFAAVDIGHWLGTAGSSLPIRGDADAQVRFAGRLPSLSTVIDASARDASVAGLAISSARLRAAGSGTRFTIAHSDADLGFATLAGEGRVGLGRADPLAFDLHVTTPDISAAVHRFVPSAAGRDVAGRLDAGVRVGGTRAAPTLTGGFEMQAARYAGLRVSRAIGELALTGKRIELRDAELELASGKALIAGSLPLVLQPFGLGPPSAAVSFDLTARSIDLAEFTPLLAPGTVLGGTLDGHLGVEGTVDRPNLSGSVAIAGGSYTGPIERVPITRVGANVDFAGTTVTLRAFHAALGHGTLDAGGQVQLPGADRPARYALDVTATAATFDLPAFGRGTLDGALTLTGTGTQPLLAGSIGLRDAVIPVSAVYGGGAAAAGAPAGGIALDPRLELTATAGDDVRVRNAIVDIGVSGGVGITGSLSAPALDGGFTATDGTISSYNHLFRIVDASVTFDPANGTVPTIAARAVTRVTNPDPDPSRNISGAANIFVTVRGTADNDNLQVTYSSDPAYSQQQIVGLLLDVPALLGAVSFNLNGGPGSPLLRGAPGPSNVLLPPGITPEQVSAVSFNQEVFSLLNGQFTQRALGPVERVFQKGLGLSDIEFTVDYGGGIGYALRRQIGKRDFYAFLSQTVTYPTRGNVGFELAPKPFETVNFSLYLQNGVTSLITNQTPGEEIFNSARRLVSVQPLGNRAGVSLNLNRRF